VNDSDEAGRIVTALEDFRKKKQQRIISNLEPGAELVDRVPEGLSADIGFLSKLSGHHRPYAHVPDPRLPEESDSGYLEVYSTRLKRIPIFGRVYGRQVVPGHADRGLRYQRLHSRLSERTSSPHRIHDQGRYGLCRNRQLHRRLDDLSILGWWRGLETHGRRLHQHHGEISTFDAAPGRPNI